MLDAFSGFSSSGGGFTIVPYIMLLSLWLGARKRQVYYTFVLSLTIFVIGVGKMLYKEDRPIWINPDLTYKNDDNCANEYGNPSGHSMVGSVLAFSVLFELLDAYKGHENKAVRNVLFALFTILAVLYSVLMALSRVVIAIHAWNQIVYGWLLGIWIAFFCKLVIQEKLYVFIEAHLLGISLQTLKKTGIAVGLMTAFTGIQIGAFYISSLYLNKTDAEQALMISNAQVICEGFKTDMHSNDKSFKGIGASNLFFGAIIGVILQAKAFEGQIKMSAPKEYKVLKWIGRLVVLIVMSLPFIVLLTIPLTTMWPSMLKNLVAVFFWNLTLTFLLDTVCLKLRLYDQK